MRKIILYILLACTMLFSRTAVSNAQQNNFDSDITAIRNNAVPDFNYSYDDYLQYSPAAVMLGMKAFGYESRSSWGRMLVSDTFSTLLMAGAAGGLKFIIERPRPDGSENNSFPSGHAAKSFMTATMLHKEYGWRSPWFSIGAYTVASASAVSRILNNRHWMTDLVGGAAIGIGAVHLGYYLTDLIFKEKGLNDSYSEPSFIYDSGVKHYVAELTFGHRHFFGNGSDSSSDFGTSGAVPRRGGMVSLSTDIPVVPNIGIKVRGSANSLIFGDRQSSYSTAGSPSSLNMYTTTAGGYWNFFYAKRFEFQAHASAGAAWVARTASPAKVSDAAGTELSSGVRADISAGLAASFMLDSNFKLKLFADYETFSSPSGRPWLNSVVLGWSSAWFW